MIHLASKGGKEGAEAVFLNRDRKRRREHLGAPGLRAGSGYYPSIQPSNNPIIILFFRKFGIFRGKTQLTYTLVGVSEEGREGLEGCGSRVTHIQFDFNFIPNSSDWGGGRQLVT